MESKGFVSSRAIHVAMTTCAIQGDVPLAMHIADKFGTEAKAVRMASFNAILHNLVKAGAEAEQFATVEKMMEQVGAEANATTPTY
jgi:hypothetical protein